jgi:alpha-tubulin suppressor-like RCC1 family protein
LGDNTVVSKQSPISVVGGFTDWCQISAGNNFSAAVRTNGTAWAWGSNSCGQLGDNTIVDKSSPVSVVGGFTDWCQVSAGSAHSLAVRQNGTAWGWGQGSAGRIGDNTITTKSSPVSVVGGFTDWCQITAGLAGAGFSLAIRQTGSLWGWGCATCGTLGDNTTVAKSSPVSVVGGFTDWCQVSAGDCHSIAIRQNGTAWSWGLGTCGRLGDNTTVAKSSPVSAVGGFTDWCQASAGGCHSLAVRQNGTAWAWGEAGAGRLGDNTVVDKSSPVSVVGGFTIWAQVSAGLDFSLGRTITTVPLQSI